MEDIKHKRKNDDKAKGLPRRWTAVIVGLCALSLLVAGGVAVRFLQRPPGPAGHLYYRIDDADYKLDYDLNLATGERVKIEDDTALRESFPDNKLSPDGLWTADWVMSANRADMRLVFRRAKGITGTSVLIVVPLSNPTYSLSWSPDSRGVLVSAIGDSDDSSDMQNFDLWFVSVAGEITRLTNNTFSEQDPSFSSDGQYIAYRATPDGFYRVYVMEMATGKVTLVNPGMYAYSYTWSPDGQWIAFETDHARPSDLWIVRRDGSDLQGVALTEEWERGPIWRP